MSTRLGLAIEPDLFFSPNGKAKASKFKQPRLKAQRIYPGTKYRLVTDKTKTKLRVCSRKMAANLYDTEAYVREYYKQNARNGTIAFVEG